MAKRLAVVTGANRGIGLSLVKALCPVFDGDVILTARDEERGKSALKKLKEEGFHAKFHQLNVTDHSSIERLRDFIQQNYGGLDLLVNNAGINNEPTDSKALFEEQSRQTMNVNYHSVVDVCDTLFPLLRPDARVCNMSSRAAFWAYHDLISESTRKILSDPSINKDELTSIMQSHIQSLTLERSQTLLDFISEAYGLSKLGLTILTRIQQRELDEQGRRNILVNAVTPGLVQTEMTSGKGVSLEEGIMTPLYVCLLPSSVDSPRGAMIGDKEVIDWENPKNAP